MTSTPAVRSLDRREVRSHLEQLSAWLLPGSGYGVEHTWPMLYRSDGDGALRGLFAGERLLAHCAFRTVDLVTTDGPRRVALLGSVATDPAHRGHGLATQLLQSVLSECRASGLAAVLLWAEQPTLYSRCGFTAGPTEQCLVLRAAAVVDPAIRPAAIADHARLLELHRRKPLRVERSLRVMSGLLTTPGMSTFVLERGGEVVAYACCGKGADLQNWWHETGGADADVAALLPGAVRSLGASASFVLLPPYRRDLPALLAQHLLERSGLDGPMVCGLDACGLPPCYVDGLDSV